MLYADYAATTSVDPRVAQKMMDCLTEQFYNPSSLYPQARGVRNAVEEARAQILALLEAEEGSILFTSGGTEADNLALLGTALHPDNHKRHYLHNQSYIHFCHQQIIRQIHLDMMLTLLAVNVIQGFPECIVQKFGIQVQIHGAVFNSGNGQKVFRQVHQP